ncbi:hypothetical protein [Nostoc sp. MG11]|nr:hypothetical protein [Nostoc sp. MG11]
MSTTGYAYASHSIFQLRITAGDVYDGLRLRIFSWRSAHFLNYGKA